MAYFSAINLPRFFCQSFSNKGSVMEEPLGPLACLAVFGLLLGAVWAVGKLIDIAVGIYVHCQRGGGE